MPAPGGEPELAFSLCGGKCGEKRKATRAATGALIAVLSKTAINAGAQLSFKNNFLQVINEFKKIFFLCENFFYN